MKKLVFAVIIAVVAASPAMAAKKSKKAPAAQPTAWELNEPGRRLFVDSLPMYLPSAVKMVLYPVGNKEK